MTIDKLSKLAAIYEAAKHNHAPYTEERKKAYGMYIAATQELTDAVVDAEAHEYEIFEAEN